MAKLWAKGYELDSLIEEFTVGKDYLLDRELVVADCAGSIAHARMLSSIGILDPDEYGALESRLRDYAEKAGVGGFRIDREDEDCHSAIENRLVSALGETGKKIHTGRSRNDQVLTALRLIERSFLLSWTSSVVALVREFVSFAERHLMTPMPGRTHLQTAMPSSVGLWAGAFAEQLVDQLVMADSVYLLVDRCPLGSAAGYGVPLAIDRERTADELGFAAVHNNVIAVANSRGETDAWLLSLLDHTGLVLSRFAQDLMLFSLPEFGYFSLPDELCTGSSIMPQKKNPDVLELIRARSATLSGYASQVASIVRSLSTGYNRDLQETKEPILRGMRSALQMARIAELTVNKIAVNDASLDAGFTPEIYATDAALELVADGVSFRDAYRRVADNIGELKNESPRKVLEKRTHTGTAANLRLDDLRTRVNALSDGFASRGEIVDKATRSLLGELIPLYLEREPPEREAFANGPE